MASKPRNSSRTSDEWVVVAEYQVDVDADMAVSLLQGNDVPAMRVPASGLVASFWAYMSPVQVLVPPDRAEEARELVQGADNVT